MEAGPCSPGRDVHEAATAAGNPDADDISNCDLDADCITVP